MNEDECKTVTIALPVYEFLKDQKKVRKLNSISDVISRIINEKRHLKVKITMLEEDLKDREAVIEGMTETEDKRTRW